MSCWSQLAPDDEEPHCLVWPGYLQILGALIFTRPIPQNLEVFGNPENFRAVCGSLFFRNPETLKFPEKPSKISWELVDEGYFSLVTLPRKNNGIDETTTSDIRESVASRLFQSRCRSQMFLGLSMIPVTSDWCESFLRRRHKN